LQIQTSGELANVSSQPVTLKGRELAPSPVNIKLPELKEPAAPYIPKR